MPASQYTVLHLPIETAVGTELSGPHFVVFWLGNTPLGHAWIEAKHHVLQANVVVQACQPALDYWRQKAGLKESPWWDLLEPEKAGEWSQFLQQLTESQNPLEALPMPVSVVICTRNRTEDLRLCLQRVEVALREGDEVVVVDNAPSDQTTHELVRNEFPWVQYVHEPTPGLDVARNTGGRKAQHSIVAYTDDDVQVPENWLGQVRKSFQQHPQAGAITGQVFPVVLNSHSQVHFEKYWGFNRGYVPKHFDQDFFAQTVDYGVPVWDFGAGANMAFRKQALELINYFDPRLDVGAAGCSGDSEIWYRLLAHGWPVHYLPQVSVHHKHREGWPSLKNQLFHYMKGHVAALWVQHEQFPHHKGNLWRLKKLLPKYYLQQWFKGLVSGFSGATKFWRLQVQGMKAGHAFYKANQQPGPQPPSLASLRTPMTTTADDFVTVVITCYNHGRYLAQAIESALHQYYPKVEVVVVDDGSTDDTRQVAERYPVRYFHQANAGLSAARNAGAARALGKWICFLDADDHLFLNALNEQIWFAQQHPEAVAIAGGHQKVNDAGEVLETVAPSPASGHVYASFLQSNFIGMHAAVLYRTSVFAHYQFDPNLPAAEDYDLMLRLSAAYPFVIHEKPLAAYRQHGQNMSRRKDFMLSHVLKVLEKQRPTAHQSGQETALEKGVANWKQFYFDAADPLEKTPA